MRIGQESTSLDAEAVVDHHDQPPIVLSVPFLDCVVGSNGRIPREHVTNVLRRRRRRKFSIGVDLNVRPPVQSSSPPPPPLVPLHL